MRPSFYAFQMILCSCLSFFFDSYMKALIEYWEIVTTNVGYFRTTGPKLRLFCKIFASSKKRIFPKNFQTSISKLFRNWRKRKVRKILSFAGPYPKAQKKTDNLTVFLTLSESTEAARRTLVKLSPGCIATYELKLLRMS